MSKFTPIECHRVGSLVRVDFNILVKGWRLECEHLIHQAGSWLITGQKIGPKKRFYRREPERTDNQNKTLEQQNRRAKQNQPGGSDSKC